MKNVTFVLVASASLVLLLLAGSARAARKDDCENAGGTYYKFTQTITQPAGSNANQGEKFDRSYCVKWHPACETENCPAMIQLNVNKLFSKADEDKVVIAEIYDCNDRGADPVDCLAEIPRRMLDSTDYRVDRNAIFLLGFSAGTGGISRGLCSRNQLQGDSSEFGTLSDVIAGIGFSGGCPSCSSDWAPICGNMHVLATNGDKDQFAQDFCEKGLRAFAALNGCDHPDAKWCNVDQDDIYLTAPKGDGSSKLRKLSFGQCAGGDVVGYVFADEGHELSYNANWDPAIKSYNIQYNYFLKRAKQGGETGSGSSAPCSGQGSQQSVSLDRPKDPRPVTV
mmetsp:Transcript_11854/g.36086  ORF Transcript_11854/g.36086 Transcript_11854/m.36086 type:complete len:338 (+) Transcript_11854:93-1106(+)